MTPGGEGPSPRVGTGGGRTAWLETAAGFFRRYPTVLSLAALAVLWAVNLRVTPNFGSFELSEGRLRGPIVNILEDACPVMLLAAGMTLVIATAGIDLSVGSVMAIGGTVAALLLAPADTAVPIPAALGLLRPDGPAPVATAVALALAVAVLLGLWNGLLVTYLRLQPIIATLILLVAGRGIAQTLSSNQNVEFTSPGFEYLGKGYLFGLPVPLYLVAGLVVVLLLALRKTVLGMYIEAVGNNVQAARMAGLKTHAIRIFAYAFSAFCAGVAGLIVAADIDLADVSKCGLYLELDAILAVVIGGTSLAGGKPRLAGALIGALIMQTLSTTLRMNGIGTAPQLMIKAAVALAVCFIQTPFLADVLRRVLARKAVPA